MRQLNCCFVHRKDCWLATVGRSDRSWLVIYRECDGLPYVLCQSVIEKSRTTARKAALAAAGIPDVGHLSTAEVKSELKGAMSQVTGLEVPRCWPQYKRMFLVRAVCVDIDSVGALS